MSDRLGPEVKRSSRVSAIDVARGSAMFFVCLSHFAFNCLARSGYQDLGEALRIASMLASPSFVLISGTVLGFRFQTRRNTFGEFRFRLADRALFMLTVGHLLLGPTCLPASHYAVGQAFAFGYITDSIAVATLIGPLLLQRLSAAPRIGLAAALLFLTWLVLWSWHPTSMLGGFVESRSFGMFPHAVYIFPVVPWIAVYLMGTVVGEGIARWFTDGLEQGAMRLMIGGAVAMSMVVGARIASRWLVTPPYRLVSAAVLLSPTQKWPPGPGYVFFFGGAGLAMIGGALLIQRALPSAAPVRWLGWVGESSLFVFFLQAYVFQVVPYLVGPRGLAFWFCYFVFAIAGMVVAARGWQRHKLNRLFTVGLPAMRRAYRRLAVPGFSAQTALDG